MLEDNAKNNLLHIYKWLTVSDAAKHLSAIFGKDVNEADVLRMALDYNLKLSLNFVNGAYAKRGRFFVEQDRPVELPDFAAGIPLSEDQAQTLSKVEGVLSLELPKIARWEDLSEIQPIWGVHDLPMYDEIVARCVEKAYQKLKNGPDVTLGYCRIIVTGEDGSFWWLHETADNWENNGNTEHKYYSPLKQPYYPSYDFPHGSEIVVRAEALATFINDHPELLSHGAIVPQQPTGAKPDIISSETPSEIYNRLRSLKTDDKAIAKEIKESCPLISDAELGKLFYSQDEHVSHSAHRKKGQRLLGKAK